MIFYPDHLVILDKAVKAAEPLILAPALHPRYIQSLLAQWQSAAPRREVRLIEPWIGSMKLTPAGLAAPSGPSAPLAQWLTEHYGDLGGSFERVWWLPDLERSLQEPQAVAVLAAICRRISASGHPLRLLTSQPIAQLPAELRPWSRSLELGAPRPRDEEDEQDGSGFAHKILEGQREVGPALLQELRAHKIEGRGDAAHIFASMLQGLDAGAMNIVVEAICRDLNPKSSIDDRWKEMERRLVEERKGQLQRASGLTVESTGDDELEGMNRFQRYLEYVDVLFRDQTYHRKEGGPRPRGVLLVGLPGCGKSLAARITARKLNVPLLRMDIGAMMGRYLGESEGNLRRALDAAEAAAPCVLWVDELEKALGGVSSGHEGGGTGSRMLAQLLTWMQSHDAQVYLFATANKVSELPPELMRRGRFDELWRVMLPREDERRQILLSKLKKVGQECAAELLDPNSAELASLVKLTKDYTGADLESLVTEGWMRARVHEEKVTLATLKAIQTGGFMPMSAQFSDKIKEDIEQLESHGFRDVSCEDKDLPIEVPKERAAQGGRLHPELAAIWKAPVGTILKVVDFLGVSSIILGDFSSGFKRLVEVCSLDLNSGFYLNRKLIPNAFFMRNGSAIFINHEVVGGDIVWGKIDDGFGVFLKKDSAHYLLNEFLVRPSRSNNDQNSKEDIREGVTTENDFWNLVVKNFRGVRFLLDGLEFWFVLDSKNTIGKLYLMYKGSLYKRGIFHSNPLAVFTPKGFVFDGPKDIYNAVDFDIIPNENVSLCIKRISFKSHKKGWQYSLKDFADAVTPYMDGDFRGF